MITTYIVTTDQELPFIQLIDSLQYRLGLHLPAAPVKGDAHLRVTAQILIPGGRPLTLNEIRVPYLPEVRVMPDFDLTIDNSDNIQLEITPGNLFIWQIFLISEADQITPSFYQSSDSGFLLL